MIEEPELRSPAQESARVRLVRPGAEHAPLWLAWRREATARRFNPLEEQDLQRLRERLAKVGTNLTQRGKPEYRLLVVSRSEPVGMVALHRIEWRMGTAEIGYHIGEAHQGEGLGTAAVRLLISAAFEQAGLRRLQALVAEGNAPSHRIMAKVGFRKEGVLRGHFVIEGEPVDEVLYGLLRTEW